MKKLFIFIIILCLFGCTIRNKYEKIGTCAVTYQNHLPLLSSLPDNSTIIGTQIEGRIKYNHQYLADGSAVMEQIRWYEVELAPDLYVFPQYILEDYEYIQYRKIFYQVKDAPKWMRVHPDLLCSQPKPEYYKSYGNFLLKIIETFSVSAIEVWNEPNTPPEIIPDGHDFYYGCWGTAGKTYEAGRDYGKMLKIIYPMVKDKYPDVDIYVGALATGDTAIPFVQGILSVGSYFDGISYHAYPTYGGTGYDQIGIWHDKLSPYTNRFAVTETSLLWWNNEPAHEKFEYSQAGYFDWAVARSKELELDWMLWYDLHNTWRHCGLVESNRIKPVWYAYIDYFSP